MYTIYRKRRFFLLTSSPPDQLRRTYPHMLVHLYNGKRKHIKKFIKNALKTKIGGKYKPKAIILYHEDVERLKADFFSVYKIIEAAGGAVFNQKNEILFIYRRGHWDLPKGKIDPGETPEITAVREVEEETGLTHIHRHEHLHTSYHIYKDRRNKKCLKPTYWYRMTTENTHLKLQHEEDIETAEWLKASDFSESKRITYGAISDVISLIIDKGVS